MRRPALTVQEAAEAWLAASGHLRPATVLAYRSSLACHILPAFGRRRLEDLIPDDLARWIVTAGTPAHRQEREPHASVPLRAATISLALPTLGRVYAHAARRQGYGGTSPVIALERSERPRTSRSRRSS